jgi:hypothetical protein
VAQAASIDFKLDDGLPNTGNVVASLFDGNTCWSNSAATYCGAISGAVSAQPGSCFDNGGNAANPIQYSLSQNGGVNCALSFRFQ